jgi:hypothetical protein
MPENPRTRNIVPHMWTHVLHKEVIRDSRFHSPPHPSRRQLPAHPSPPRAPNRLYITPTKWPPAATTPIPLVPLSAEPPPLSPAIPSCNSPVVARRPHPGTQSQFTRAVEQSSDSQEHSANHTPALSDSDRASYSLDLPMATTTAWIQ